MISVTCFGTCRIHNPLKRLAQLKLIKLNNNPKLQAYVHSTEEILQQIEFIKGKRLPPQEMWDLVIDKDFQGSSIVENFENTDVFVVEISTTKIYQFREYILKLYDVQSLLKKYQKKSENSSELKAKSDISLDINCSKKPWIEKDLVENYSFKRQSLNDVKKGMNKIVSTLGKKVIFVTYINSVTEQGNTLPSRERLISTVETHAKTLQSKVFNPTYLVRKYGQAVALKNNGQDINHYNSFFFQVVGCHLFENYLINLYQSKSINTTESIDYFSSSKNQLVKTQHSYPAVKQNLTVDEQIQSIKLQGLDRLKRINYSSIKDIKPIFGEPVIYDISVDGVSFEMFAHLKQNSPFLYVFNPAAVDRSKYQLPVFHRWTWAVRCPYSTICLNDPTLYLGSLEIGWFQGSPKQHYLPIVCDIIRALAKQINLQAKDILFSGSSAGGFSSLMMAGNVRDSSALVINPQTDILQYATSRVRDILRTSFSGITTEQAQNQCASRFSVSEYYRSIGYIPRIYYLQNTTDKTHWKEHYLSFIEAIGNMARERKDYWFDKISIQTEVYCHGNHKEGSKAVSFEHWMERAESFRKISPIENMNTEKTVNKIKQNLIQLR